MNQNVQFFNDPALPPINDWEVFRYMGTKEVSEEMQTLVLSCIDEARKCFGRRVCYREFDACVIQNTVALGFTSVISSSLAKNLEGCDRIILFAATLGLGIDRLIAKYSRLSPARALCLQALGTERIEALCHTFCCEMAKKYGRLKPRFSPGYGDLPLELQRDIFRALDCPNSIGLSLNQSLLMTPTKSVTAIVGIRR